MFDHLRCKVSPFALGIAVTAASLAAAALISGVVTVQGMQRKIPPPAGEPPQAATSMEARGAAVATSRDSLETQVDRSACTVCGVVEAVRPFEIRSSTTVPEGAERALGDNHVVPRTAYRVTVRMDDGSYRTLSQPTKPTVVPGNKVRIADGAVLPM